MSRRSHGYKRRSMDEPRIHGPRECEKTTMLNLRRLSAFKYDLRQIMSYYKISETAASSIMAGVIARSSRISIESAVAYVREQQNTGLYPSESLIEISDLLDRFSTLR